jgi:hypothetical protein
VRAPLGRCHFAVCGCVVRVEQLVKHPHEELNSPCGTVRDSFNRPSSDLLKVLTHARLVLANRCRTSWPSRCACSRGITTCAGLCFDSGRRLDLIVRMMNALAPLAAGFSQRRLLA